MENGVALYQECTVCKPYLEECAKLTRGLSTSSGCLFLTGKESDLEGCPFGEEIRIDSVLYVHCRHCGNKRCTLTAAGKLLLGLFADEIRPE